MASKLQRLPNAPGDALHSLRVPIAYVQIRSELRCTAISETLPLLVSGSPTNPATRNRISTCACEGPRYDLFSIVKSLEVCFALTAI